MLQHTKNMTKILSVLLCALLLPFCTGAILVTAEAKETASVPIIMYHSVCNGKQNAYVIKPETLENDLVYLKEKGYTAVLTGDVVDWVEKGITLPEKPIMLTFDDGHYNFLSAVLPLIEKYDMKAVVSVVGEYTDLEEGQEKRSSNYSYLNRDEIRELTSHSRIEVQNHSYGLHSGAGALPRKNESYEVYKKRLLDDLAKCDALIRDCGGNPTVFTCPFGKYGGFTKRAVIEAGYKAMLICEEGTNRIEKGDTDSLFRLKRYIRPCGISSKSYFCKKGIE